MTTVRPRARARGAALAVERIATEALDSIARNVPKPLDVHVEVCGGDVRVPVEDLVLSGTVAAGCVAGAFN